MELYVLDVNFKLLGVIDNYDCLVWTRNYYKPDTFSMQIIPNFEQFKLLKKGNILLKRDNTKEAMYIDHRELEENEEGIEVLVVSGYSLTKWLDRRITLYKEVEKANAETVMKSYVNRHCINPAEANRKIDNLVLGINNNLGQEIDYLSHYEPLLEELEDIAKVNELGYKIDLDLANKQYLFQVYQGLDRTINQELNSKALDRYELFVDARDISDTKQQGDNEIEIPLEEYNKLLENRGKEKLSECTKIETFDCVLNNINSLEYRQDFDLGDKVSIINKKWGLMLNERIVSITETYDVEGLNIDIEIGNNIPTLIDKIKKKMR